MPNTVRLTKGLFVLGGLALLALLTVPPAAHSAQGICPGAPPSQLTPGLRVFVGLEPPTPSRVREVPGTSGRILGQLQPGAVAVVLGGPVCSDGLVWWRISAESTSLSGWSAEGDLRDYWILPCPGQAAGSDCQVPSGQSLPDAAELNLRVTSVPANGELIFSDSDGALWGISAAGRGLRQLAPAGGFILTASASPDGRWLAYSRLLDGPDYRRVLWLVDLQTAEPKMLSESHTAGLSWAPDSQSLVYDRALDVDTCMGGPWPTADGLWRADIATGETELWLPASEGYPLVDPKWSPDGSTLTFFKVVYCEGRGPLGIWGVGQAGYRTSEASVGTLDWSPDGQWLVYDTRTYVEPAPNLWLVRSDGTGRRALPGTGGYAELGPLWSPDGSRILFGRSAAEMRDPELYVLDLATGAYRLGTDAVYEYGWSPDGQQVGYSTPDRKLYVIDAEGGALHEIGQGRFLAWAPRQQDAATDLADLIQTKRALAAALTQTDAVVGYEVVRVPLTAYNERPTLELLRDLAQASAVSPEQTAALERLVLQEEALASTLQDYTQVSGYQADAAADAGGILWGTIKLVPKGFGGLNAKDILKKLVRDVGVIVGSRLPEGSPVRIALMSALPATLDWYEVKVEKDPTKYLEIFTETTLREALAQRNLNVLLGRVQPTLDQGVRSVRGEGLPIWPVAGATNSARLQMDGVIVQSQLQAENATNWHDGLDRGRQANALAQDLSDALTMGGVQWARAGSVWTRFQQLLIDIIEGFGVMGPTLECIGHLSERAGSLAFNPSQPVAHCQIVGATTTGHRGQATPPERIVSLGNLRAQAKQDLDQYTLALSGLRAALEGHDADAFSAALEDFQVAQTRVNDTTTWALIAATPAEQNVQSGSLARGVLDLDSQALLLLIRIGAYLETPEPGPTTAELLAELDETVRVSTELQATLATQITSGEPIGLATLEVVPPSHTGVVDQTGVVMVRIKNVGNADLANALLQAEWDGQVLDPIDVGPLPAGTTADVAVPMTPKREGQSTLYLVLSDGVHVDNGSVQIEILPATQTDAADQTPSATSPATPAGPSCIPGLAVGLILVGAGLKRRKGRQVQAGD